jgi:ribosome-associated toxin RatA of RatAB toxin-antitoxin module/heme-degrading monooxygenase HmoA
MNNLENHLTLINVFPVEPEKQERLIEILTRAVTETMRQQPGFISARVYRGITGNYVANLVQWRSREDFNRMWQQAAAQEHVAEVHTVARGNPQLFELSNAIEGLSQESAGGNGAQLDPVLAAEHDIVISKPWKQCFELCADLNRWPEFMPAVHKAKILRESHGDQEIELTANFGNDVVSWRSRREILPEAKTIRFWSLTPRAPIKALAGEWFFEPEGRRKTRVRVAHKFELADLAQETAVRARISQNMIGDLVGMKNYMERKI